MANKPKTEKKKISNRRAITPAGESTNDYTEAVRAQYSHITSGATADWDFTPQLDAMLAGGVPPEVAHVVVAFAIEGFITKTGHAVNKATKSKNADQDVPKAIEAFMANAREGGWTNREGGMEVNAAAIIAAYAEILELQDAKSKGRTPDAASHEAMRQRVALGWNGGTKPDGTKVAPWGEARKAQIRADNNVKAVAAEQKAAKLRAQAGAAPSATPLPGLDDLP